MKVYVITVEYRKPSQGNAGVIGTYVTKERAEEEFAKLDHDSCDEHYELIEKETND